MEDYDLGGLLEGLFSILLQIVIYITIFCLGWFGIIGLFTYIIKEAWINL